MRHYMLVAILAAVMGGCTVLQKGTTVTKIQGEDNGTVIPAPADAEYGLYGATDAKAIIAPFLKKGENIGFRREGGKVIAVYGNEQKPLESGTYYWNRR